MKKCLLIYNANSGKGIKGPTLSRIIKTIERSGYEVNPVKTEYNGHASEIVEKSEHVDLVISIGGDGTCNETVSGNLRRKDRLLTSHIPLGTTNDVGHMFGLTKSLFKNLDLILNGKPKYIDVCTINDQAFVYVAGFGKFMNVPYETPRELKKRLGYAAYLIEGIKAFNDKTKSYEITYTVNGEEYKGFYSFIIASSANHIAGINNFFKDVKLNDGKFEVLLCNITKKSDIIKSIYYLRTHDITKIPGFYFHRTDHINFKFKDLESSNWCIDGEKLKSTKKEYDLRVINDYKMLLPSKLDNKLFIKRDDSI